MKRKRRNRKATSVRQTTLETCDFDGFGTDTEAVFGSSAVRLPIKKKVYCPMTSTPISSSSDKRPHEPTSDLSETEGWTFIEDLERNDTYMCNRKKKSRKTKVVETEGPVKSTAATEEWREERKLKNNAALPCRFCGERIREKLKRHLLRQHSAELSLDGDSKKDDKKLNEEVISTRRLFYSAKAPVPESIAIEAFGAELMSDQKFRRQVKQFSSILGVNLTMNEVVVEAPTTDDTFVTENESVRKAISAKGFDATIPEDHEHIQSWVQHQKVMSSINETAVDKYSSNVRRCLAAIAKSQNVSVGHDLLPLLNDVEAVAAYLIELKKVGVSCQILSMYNIT